MGAGARVSEGVATGERGGSGRVDGVVDSAEAGAGGVVRVEASSPVVRRMSAGMWVRMEVILAVSCSSMLCEGLKVVVRGLGNRFGGLCRIGGFAGAVLHLSSFFAFGGELEAASISAMVCRGVPERDGGEEVKVKSDRVLKKECRRLDALIEGDVSCSRSGVPDRECDGDGPSCSICPRRIEK